MNVKHPKKSYTTPDLSSEKMKISLENTNKLLGLKLSEKEMIRCLEKMGYNYRKGQVEIPAWRTDILHEHDLIEDVAIGYGYNNLVPKIPKISFTGREDPIEVKKRKIAEIIQGLGMLETSNYHLTTVRDQFKTIGMKKENYIELEDSKTEYNILRRNLVHYALKILGQNLDSEYPQKIFELGRIFEPDPSKDSGVKEEERLCIAIADSQTGFTDIKQTLDYLMRTLGIEYTLEEAESPIYIPGRTAKILVNNQSIGYMGEVKPSILNNLKVKMPITALEINVNSLF